MLPAETSASSGPAAHRAWCCRAYPVSATSVAVSAALASAPVSSRRPSGPERTGNRCREGCYFGEVHGCLPMITTAAPVSASIRPRAAAGAAIGGLAR